MIIYLKAIGWATLIELGFGQFYLVSTCVSCFSSKFYTAQGPGECKSRIFLKGRTALFITAMGMC